MDLIKIEKDDYERYEELLLRRDAYRKEARAAQILYVREFGGEAAQCADHGDSAARQLYPDPHQNFFGGFLILNHVGTD